jgi:hypothetical protein
MPHDKNGSLLFVGDEVILRAKVLNITEGETACNITTEALERPEGEEYYPKICGCSRFYEKTGISDNDAIAYKQLRKAIDAQIQNLKSLTPSRERSLAITKLQEAAMWLGMDLKRLNEPNPYPNSKDPTNTKIEPTAAGLKL